jgi:peptidoglycan/LPS O-acetylase OafA/YrhL
MAAVGWSQAALATSPGRAQEAGVLAGAGPPPAAGTATGRHIPALDGVRGLAILMVMLFHFVAQTAATNRFEAGLGRVFSYGVLGVDLFFLLSGFLITGILYDARGEPGYFRSFYIRRALRIFPLYYGVLALVFFVLPLVPALRGSEIAGLGERQVWAWLYAVNVYLAVQGDWAYSYMGHFWSLAVEEHFYLVWPVLVWWLADRPRMLMGATLAIAAASFAVRTAATLGGVGPVATTVLTPFQLDALCLGGFFAVYLRQPGGEAAVRRAVLPLTVLAGGALVVQFGLRRYGDGDGLASLRTVLFRVLLAALLLHAVFAPAASAAGRVLRSGVLTLLGRYSYGLYVFHHFLSYYFVRHGTEFTLARAVGSHTAAVALQALGGIAASMAIAWLSYELFERHFLQLKRFWPSRKAVAAALAVAAVPALGACARSRTAEHPGTGAERITTAIKLDHFGYRPDDAKVAILTADPGPTVHVRTPEGVVALAVPGHGGSIEDKGQDRCSGGRIWWVDFSSLRARGRYHIFSPSLGARSYEFVIAPDVYGDVMRAALKTFYRQRCGTAKAAVHAGAWADGSACHGGDARTPPAAGHPDRGLRDLTGGWHDAGDYNKYAWYAASNAVLSLLRAWEEDPGAFPDGDLGIPESGNGVSDLLDEVKWELDFLLRMQLPDGSVLSRVHAGDSANGASPPSADRTQRYYSGPTLDSAAVLAGSAAVGARVFAAAGQGSYAATLKEAALAAWGWLEGRGDGHEKAWAAAEIFRMDPTVASAARYVDGYHAAGWGAVTLDVARYDTQAALTYVRAASATPAVVSAMKAGIARQVARIFAADDLYRSGIPSASYHWGSNAVRAAHGLFLLQAARLGATGSYTPEECRRHALDILHSFHGQNALSMVYLTNMASGGGEHSSWQIFHNWFGQSEDPYSRARYVGKPRSVVEPHYPYFPGPDNHGVRDDKTSALGPAPGFVPGGPNQGYTGDARPPGGGACPERFYRDWNDQAAWTARTWEITETSIGYQGPYVALAAAFVGCLHPPASACGLAPGGMLRGCEPSLAGARGDLARRIDGGANAAPGLKRS